MNLTGAGWAVAGGLTLAVLAGGIYLAALTYDEWLHRRGQ